MVPRPLAVLGLVAAAALVSAFWRALSAELFRRHPNLGGLRRNPFQSPPPAARSRTRPAMAAPRTAAVVFSHGLGDSSAGWASLSTQLGPALPWVKWVFPDAPVQPVTLNMNMRMQSWFDIYDLSDNAREDETGLMESVETIRSLVKKEMDNGIPSERIVVGGFSQGAVISVLTGITSPHKLAGVVSLSGWLALRNKTKEIQGPHAANLPVFWGHGIDDPVVQYHWGNKSVEFMKKELQMTEIEFKSYPGLTHSASVQELEDLTRWLLARLPSQ